MDHELMFATLLVALIVFFSLEFDKPYAPAIHSAARHPLARFIAGLGIVYLATSNSLHAVLALIVVFFWIADVNLLSSFSL